MNRSLLPTLVLRLGSFALAALGVLFGTLLAAGCGSSTPSQKDEAPVVETRADSLAMQLYEASGSHEVWQDTPALAFTFAVDRQAQNGDMVREEVAHHWWRRTDGSYRVQWSDGPDSTYTAVFDVDEFGTEPPTGRAALNGAPLDSAAAQSALLQAHGRFANDTYWLLAPLKLFNDGVTRSVSPDPSREDSSEVLSLAFQNVGVTPDDRYWLMPDSTGRLGHWTFVLQGTGPEQAPGTFEWTGYETLDTPGGPLTLSTRKENASGPGVVYTDEIRTPEAFPDSLFQIGGTDG